MISDAAILFRSWAVSGTLGFLWVLLVQFGPLTALEHLLPPEDRPVSITFMAPVVAPAAVVASIAAPSGGGTAGAAFGAGSSGPVGDVTGLLRGVAVASGAPRPGSGGKTVLAYGEGGQGSRTPGTVSMGEGGTDSIGTVSGESGFGYEGVVVGGIGIRESRISGPKGDASALGNAVRSHGSQLRFCYVEEGLKVNPSLAGSIVLVLTLDSGIVTAASIGHRTWVGAEEVEACILQKAQAWHMPSGSGTFEFSLNFTK